MTQSPHHSHRQYNTLVVGLGNELRADDAVGPTAIRHIPNQLARHLELTTCATPLDLINRWVDRDVILIDAVRGDDHPNGTVITLEPLRYSDDRNRLKRLTPSVSSHGVGLMETLELAESIQHAPKRLVIIGVYCDNFEIDAALSSALISSFESINQRIEDHLAEQKKTPLPS